MLTPSLLEQADKLAEARGVTRSELIEQVLRQEISLNLQSC
ncbi:MAG: ribbon-helix-helix protein, CopG family [Chroococcidiopsidaceae cyanobacterium CP_BM_RX_35]|nr:ribbon-helix-helix protein, CopG family [Chroococcidiopsidaceae cyanobacterium CP_BM_RX_35]